MLHQLMWECCWSLTANNVMYTVWMWWLFFFLLRSRHTASMLTSRDMREIQMKPSPPHPPTPFTHSPPPCRCWMGGLLYHTCWWWSYSSCQAPSCLLHQSEYRRSQPSQLNCCSHSTWTDGGDGGKTLHWQQESIKDSDKHPWKNWFTLITNKCCTSLEQNSAYVFSWFKALLRAL